MEVVTVEQKALNQQLINSWLPFGQKLLKSNYKRIDVSDYFYDNYKVSSQEILDCGLELYMQETIPKKVIKKIRKAKLFGFKKFFVCWIKKPKDPIVIAKFGNFDYFIAEW